MFRGTVDSAILSPSLMSSSTSINDARIASFSTQFFCTTHRSVLAAQEFDAPLHDFGSAVSVLGSFRQSISLLANLRCRAGGPLPRRALSLLRRWIETCFVRVVNLIGASASNLVTFASNFRSGSLLSHFIINLFSLLFS